jgi:hypothetical protein
LTPVQSSVPSQFEMSPPWLMHPLQLWYCVVFQLPFIFLQLALVILSALAL